MHGMSEQPHTKNAVRECHPRRVISDADIDNLLHELRLLVPSATLCFKTDSRLQQAIGALVRPFNPTYLTEYTTVMNGKIWLPSRDFLRSKSHEWLYALIRHEGVHLRDMKRFPGVFQLSYLLLLPSGLTFRAYWEWRAYKVSLQTQFELYGVISDQYLEHLAERFTGPSYLFMWPFPRHIRRVLQRERERIYQRMHMVSGPRSGRE